MSEQRIDLGTLYQEIVDKLQELAIRTAELRGQKDLIERLIQQAQRPTLSGDPLDDQVRDDRDMLMSRLGEAHQTIDVMEEGKSNGV